MPVTAGALTSVSYGEASNAQFDKQTSAVDEWALYRKSYSALLAHKPHETRKL